MENKIEKFNSIYADLENGNHSDFNKSVCELDKIELVMFITYLDDCGSDFGVLRHTVTDRVLRALYSGGIK